MAFSVCWNECGNDSFLVCRSTILPHFLQNRLIHFWNRVQSLTFAFFLWKWKVLMLHFLFLHNSTPHLTRETIWKKISHWAHLFSDSFCCSKKESINLTNIGQAPLIKLLIFSMQRGHFKMLISSQLILVGVFFMKGNKEIGKKNISKLQLTRNFGKLTHWNP